MTLESDLAAIVATGTALSLETSTDSKSLYGVNGGAGKWGVGCRGSVAGHATDSSNSAHEIKNISGLEPAPGNVDNPFEIFGQTRPLDNPIRKTWTVTITRKAEDKLFLKLFSACRFGVTGTIPALFDGLSTYPNETGFRIYVWDGSTADGWDVYNHGTIAQDGYKVTLSPTGVTEEQLVFSGGLWSPALVTGSATLTTISYITQA